MKNIVVLGAGMTQWGKYPDRSTFDLGVEAVFKALDDAKINWPQIQGLACSIAAFDGAEGIIAGNVLSTAMGDRGIPVQNIFNGCAVGGSTLRSAISMILSGECDITMAVGLDKSPDGFLPGSTTGPDDMDTRRWKMMGISNPGYWALECRRRMEELGTSEEVLAMAKVAASRHGVMNPMARFRKEFSIEEVLASPMVVDPLHLYEICATSDGAAAVILANAETARKISAEKPIKLRGVSLSTPTHGDPTMRPVCMSAPVLTDVPVLPDVVNAAKRVYEMAGTGPEDIDFVEIPDNSSWHYLSYLEKMGFYEAGGAD
ncbi:MAG: transporter, partial [Deltaproteobacteria bacterium]|nr:transporter [Deltaproteobacteria bacterium]